MTPQRDTIEILRKNKSALFPTDINSLRIYFELQEMDQAFITEAEASRVVQRK